MREHDEDAVTKMLGDMSPNKDRWLVVSIADRTSLSALSALAPAIATTCMLAFFH